jgi:hypothetical protein
MWEFEAINTLISKHAIDRMRNRGNMGQNSDIQIAHRLRIMLRDSEEQQLKPGYDVVALLNHDFKKARYFRHGKWIIVMEDNTIATVHSGGAKRWESLAKIHRTTDKTRGARTRRS